jgi:hypothetical protein
VNNLTDGTEHPVLANGSKTDAALFSEEQIIISGTGELNITSRYKHGIVSDDYIKVISGTINILSTILDGLHANDYIVIDGGEININATSNGIEVERGYIVINGGKLVIDAINDGIKSSYQDGDITIYPFIHILNGVVHITSQNEGIISTSDINIYGGNLIITSIDDAISSDGSIYLDGGVHYLHSTEKQSLDGDIRVEIAGGISVLLSDGDTASIESDEGYIAILGGTVIAAGPVDIDISDSTQGYIKYGSVIENQILNVQDSSSILTIAFIADYTHVILSTPEMEVGDSLDIYHNGGIIGNNFYGIYTSGTYSNGELSGSYPVE